MTQQNCTIPHVYCLNCNLDHVMRSVVDTIGGFMNTYRLQLICPVHQHRPQMELQVAGETHKLIVRIEVILL